MRKVSVSGVVCVAIFLAAAGCSQGEWTDYNSAQDGFKARFPGTPTVKSDTQTMGPGIRSVANDYTVNPKYGIFGNKYTVYVMSIQADDPDTLTFDEDAALAGARQGITKEGGKLVGEKTIEHMGYNGWEFEVTSETTDSTVRMFRKGFAIYGLEVARKKGKKVDEDRQRFFDSFEFTDESE